MSDYFSIFKVHIRIILPSLSSLIIQQKFSILKSGVLFWETFCQQRWCIGGRLLGFAPAVPMYSITFIYLRRKSNIRMRRISGGWLIFWGKIRIFPRKIWISKIRIQSFVMSASPVGLIRVRFVCLNDNE